MLSEVVIRNITQLPLNFPNTLILIHVHMTHDILPYPLSPYLSSF